LKIDHHDQILRSSFAEAIVTDYPTDNDSQPPLLLTLPVELLQRVTKNLNDETLTTFRITCKAIETATFDQFARTFFTERYCDIWNQSRWILLNKIVASRLVNRIHNVVFTTNMLEPHSSQDIQLAPERPRSHTTVADAMQDAQFQASFHDGDILTWPSSRMIKKCLQSVNELAPNVLVGLKVEFDIEGEQLERLADVLAGIAAGQLVFHMLETSDPSLTKLTEHLDTLGLDFMSRASTIRHIWYHDFEGGTDTHWEGRKQTLSLLKSVDQLCTLNLPLKGLHARWLPSAATILSANDFTHLTTFHLSITAVACSDLAAAMSRCKSTLIEVRFNCITMLADHESWLDIFRVLNSMPRLSRACFHRLHVDVALQQLLDFIDLVHGKKTSDHDMIEYAGREQVITGLAELVEADLTTDSRARSAR